VRSRASTGTTGERTLSAVNRRGFDWRKKRLRQILRRLVAFLGTDPGPSPKIFCIGLNKTGTTTMQACFLALGLSPVASPGQPNRRTQARLFKNIMYRGNYRPALRYARRYRSFEDRPWNVWDMYQHLDRTFPDSRFILTTRDPDDWWRAVSRWLTHEKPHLVDRYMHHLKAPAFEEQAFIDGFEAYNADVRRYFGSRDDFLVFDVCAGGEWKPLCTFLHLPVPDVPFPHRNRQNYTDGPRNQPTSGQHQ